MMERNNDRISSFQLSMILCITLIAEGILDLPRTLVRQVGPDAWVVILITTILVFIFSYLMLKNMNAFSGQTFLSMNQKALGTVVGNIVGIGFMIYLILFCAMELRVFGEIIKEYLLFNTPIEILMITLLFGVSYLVRSGIECIARMSQILFPVITLFTSIIILPVIPEIDISNLLPVFHTPITQIIKAIPTIFFSFAGIEMIFILSFFVIDQRNIKKYTGFSILTVCILYISMTVIVIARFGLVETTHIIWPSLELFKTVDLPGAFIENIEIFVMAVWVVFVFMSIAILYFGATFMCSRIIGSKEHNYLVLPILIVIYFLAMIPENIVQVQRYTVEITNYLGGIYIVVLPLLLLVTRKIRNKGGQKHA